MEKTFLTSQLKMIKEHMIKFKRLQLVKEIKDTIIGVKGNVPLCVGIFCE